MGFEADVKISSRGSLGLLRLLDSLEQTATPSLAVRNTMAANIVALTACRSRRLSAIAADLPDVQKWAERVIAVTLILGFLLVDLGAPKLEALLFSAVVGVFSLIASFLEDLSDPFGGAWNVGDARAELEALVEKLGFELD